MAARLAQLIALSKVAIDRHQSQGYAGAPAFEPEKGTRVLCPAHERDTRKVHRVLSLEAREINLCMLPADNENNTDLTRLRTNANEEEA